MADSDNNTKILTALGAVSLTGAGALGGYHLEPDAQELLKCDCAIEVQHATTHLELEHRINLLTVCPKAETTNDN